MVYRKHVAPTLPQDFDSDDTVTESTEQLVRNSDGFFFDILLDIMECQVKQPVDL